MFLVLSLCRVSYATNWCDDTDIVGCYTMNADEDPIQDQSENGYDCTSYGSPTYTSSGKYGGGFVFDGSSDYMKCGDVVDGGDLTDYPFTYVVWVDLEAKTTYQAVVDLSDESYINRSQNIGATSSEVLWGRSRSSVANGQMTGSINLSSPDQFRHIAFVVTSDNSREMFVDGVSENTNTGTVDFEAGFNMLSLGRSGDSSADNYFEGVMDEVGVFSSNLSSTDINDIMLNGLVQASSGNTLTLSDTNLYDVIFN